MLSIAASLLVSLYQFTKYQAAVDRLDVTGRNPAATENGTEHGETSVSV
jgi:hypothetical protein